MDWYKTSQDLQNNPQPQQKPNFPAVLSSDQMFEFILESGLRDCAGKLCYNSAKEIANGSGEWRLTEIYLDQFDWVSDPKYRNKSKKFPPIVINYEGSYEVLDGKHRIGMAKALGIKTMWVYFANWS